VGSPPLLKTKLHPPPAREQTVARARLLDRLDMGPEIKLTVVAAPAGSGKTTLLGTWHEASERPIAWLTLDEGDNDPVVLWSYVLAALRGVCPELAEISSPERLGSARTLKPFLAELINALAALGDAALVLDDFHRLTRGDARDSVAWFIDRAPASFQVVLATRNEPALALGSLRAHGALIELRADELSFTESEAELFLNDRLELGLDRSDVDDLVERTEGWPAGLYLAALSLRAVDDRRRFIRSFGGKSRHVVDFLVDEVLEAHDPKAQELMLRSSILDRLSGPLCDAVLEQAGSDGLLVELARENLFLMPLDDQGEWYRFHHLFAQLLRVELEHREPGLTSELHRRAFTWHRDGGSVGEAVEHAIEAGMFAEASELIAAAWIDYTNAGRYATVLSWIERFPREMVGEDSRLQLVAGWVLSLCGKREAAREAIAAVERLGGLDAGPLPDGFCSVESSLVTLRGLFNWGNVGAAIDNARRAVELEGPESSWRSVATAALGIALLWLGEPHEADRWLEEAVERASPDEQWVIAATALAYRSIIAGELGRSNEQTRLAESAVQTAQEHGFEGIGSEGYLALGVARATNGRHGEGLLLIGRAIEIHRTGGHPMPYADTLLRQAVILRAANDHDAASAALAEAKEVIASCVDPGTLRARLTALEDAPRVHRQTSESGDLSDRELVILRMLSGSLSERDIGRELYLSHNTVHSHTKSIYRKLGVTSRTQALEHARELGLI
jgi:LuxR family maltose regulon positive regulatory protein